MDHRNGPAMALNFDNFAALHHSVQNALALVSQFCRGNDHISKIPILANLARTQTARVARQMARISPIPATKYYPDQTAASISGIGSTSGHNAAPNPAC